MEIISAYIPAELKDEIDSYIMVNLSRSRIVTQALELWLKQKQQKEQSSTIQNVIP